MQFWLIYAIASGAVGFVVIWTMWLKKLSFRRLDWKQSLSIVLVLVLVASAVPSVVAWNAERSTVQALNLEAQDLIDSFIEQYGEDAGLVRIEKPEDVYLVFRTVDDGIQVSALVKDSPVLGTVWLELGTLNDEETESEE